MRGTQGHQSTALRLLFATSLALSGCVATTDSGTDTSTGTNTGSQTSTQTSPTLPTVSAFSQLIQQYRPAVVVRDISCLSCHSIVQGSIITDLGSPDAWFLNGYQNPTSAGTTHYTAIDWQTFKTISGQIVVPNVTVPNSFVQSQLATGTLPVNGTTSLQSYLTRTDLQNFWGTFWFNYFGMPIPATTSFTNNVSPVAGAAVLSPRTSVYIAAPTAAQILAVVTAPSDIAPWVQVKGSSSAGISGLSVVTGVNGQSYVTNTGNINCSGQDVVINGTLLLNNGNFYAEQGGCRLYVTGSVFVEGPLNYLSSGATPDPTQNIQITSATSIVMGVGLNGWASNGDGSQDCVGSNPLQVRLFCDDRENYYFRGATNAADYATYANGIYAEATNIGVTLLQDASVPGTAPSALSAAQQRRTAIDYEHLLLNAPMIQSRYLGTLLGMVVGESATFSLGEFSVIYDPVFGTVPIFPGFPVPSLCIDNNCNCDGTTTTTTSTATVTASASATATASASATVTATATASATATDSSSATDTTTTTTTSSDTATATSTALEIDGFDLTTTDDSADLIWQTNVPATGAIYWGLNASALTNSMAEGSGYVTVHSVSVAGLASGTPYFFQSSSTDANGNTVYSAVISKVTK